LQETTSTAAAITCHHVLTLPGCPPSARAAGSLAAQIDAEFNTHMVAVEGHTDAIITGCFALLPRLAEIESMVGGWVGGRVGAGGWGWQILECQNSKLTNFRVQNILWARQNLGAANLSGGKFGN
jgi:hypothetical protein